MAEIVCAQDIQTRAQLDDETINEYSAAMQAGTVFPPVILFQFADGTLLLADGFHRVAAARKAGRAEIHAEVRIGERQEAVTYALGANTQHGLRRTNADKRRCVEVALREFANCSDRRLADLCCVTDFLVRSVRAQLRDSRTSPTARRVGKDGKAYAQRDRDKVTPNIMNAAPEGQTEPTRPLVQQTIGEEIPIVSEAKANHGTQADQQIISTFRQLIEKAVIARPVTIPFFRARIAAIGAWLDGLSTIPAPAGEESGPKTS